MTVSQLHSKLCDLIVDHKGNYRIVGDAIDFNTDSVTYAECGEVNVFETLSNGTKEVKVVQSKRDTLSIFNPDIIKEVP